MSTPDNRSVNFFSLFRRGQHYSKTWSLGRRLAPVFVENRVIKMTRYAIRFMPPIAVFTLCWQIALAIRDEVVDLEKAGVGVVQVDEPALREGLPLQQNKQEC